MTYVTKLNLWFDSSLQRQCCSWGEYVDIKFTPLSWALIFKSVTITSRSWSFSKSTIWLCVTHWATGTNSRQTIEYNLFQVHNLPPLVCNNIRLMVCLGLGRIEQGGHPVLRLSSEGNAQEGTGCWQRAKNTEKYMRRGPTRGLRALEGLNIQ